MTTGLWPAPTAAGPVDAVVRVPGSKSITNRALLLGALAEAPLSVQMPLIARDTELMIGALIRLGAMIVTSSDHLVITPGPLRGPTNIACGLAGTVMRFVPPAAALADGVIHFDGDEAARLRPMGALLGALDALGCMIKPAGAESLPFAIDGAGGLAGGTVTLDASASSQFVSGLLLAGARYDAGITVYHDGKPLPSMPHVELTVAMLRDRGVVVDDGDQATWRVEPGPIGGGTITIEPDLSGAAPFLAAAVVTGGRVVVPGWPEHTAQPGDRLRELLALTGSDVGWSERGLAVTGTGTVGAFDVDLHDVGELAPVIAALAALADGPCHLRGIAHLRGHETDRLRALATELTARGAAVDELADGLAIHPRPLHGGVFRTYEDHRMVMAAAVLGLAVPGIEIENPETVAKTMPDFLPRWRSMLAATAAART